MINKLKDFNNALNALTAEINQLYNLDVSNRPIINALGHGSCNLELNQLARMIIDRKEQNYNCQLSKLTYHRNITVNSYVIKFSEENLEQRLKALEVEYKKAMLKVEESLNTDFKRSFNGKELTINGACSFDYSYSLGMSVYSIAYQLNPEYLNALIFKAWGISDAYIVDDVMAWNELRANELSHELFNVKCFKNGNVKISLKAKKNVKA